MPMADRTTRRGGRASPTGLTDQTLPAEAPYSRRLSPTLPQTPEPQGATNEMIRDGMTSSQALEMYYLLKCMEEVEQAEVGRSPNPSDVITDNEAESMSPDVQVQQETMPMNFVRRSISPPQVLNERPTQQPLGRRETNMHSQERGTREREAIFNPSFSL